MSLILRSSAALLMFGLLAGSGDVRAADATNGGNVFATECADCHSLTAGKAKKGPSLAGIIGRKAGSVADFPKYSDALKASGITWSADKIAAYVRDPRKAVPGGTMKYDGLADDKAVGDLLAYLGSAK